MALKQLSHTPGVALPVQDHAALDQHHLRTTAVIDIQTEFRHFEQIAL